MTAALALIGVLAFVFPCQRDMIYGHAFAKDGCQAASGENPADTMNARRVVGEVVSDDFVCGAENKRERNWKLLIGGDPFPDPVDPSFRQIGLQSRDASLVKPVFHENHVPEHGRTGTERSDLAPDGYGLAILQEKENWKEFNVDSGRVAFVGRFERCLDGGAFVFVPSQRHAGRVNGDIDPSSGALNEGGLSNISLSLRLRNLFVGLGYSLLSSDETALGGLKGQEQEYKRGPSDGNVYERSGIGPSGQPLFPRPFYPVIGLVPAIVCGWWSGRSLILGHAVGHAVGWLGEFVGTVLFLLGMANLYAQVLP